MPVNLGSFTSINVSISQCGSIGTLQLNRPHKSNAFHWELWQEFPTAVKLLDETEGVRVVLLLAAGKNFCAGIDTAFLATTFTHTTQPHPCPARSRDKLRRQILLMQDAFTALETCRWPVIAAVQGACVGAGVDMITACDIRYCSEDAKFCVKEIDLAITADIGTLQRLPHIVGHGAAMELALTARTLTGREAASMGLVTRCLPSQHELHEAALMLAGELAVKSPLALMGTKRVLLHARSHSVQEGLEYVALWNSALLVSEDMGEVVAARAAGRAPRFSRL